MLTSHLHIDFVTNQILSWFYLKIMNNSLILFMNNDKSVRFDLAGPFDDVCWVNTWWCCRIKYLKGWWRIFTIIVVNCGFKQNILLLWKIKNKKQTEMLLRFSDPMLMRHHELWSDWTIVMRYLKKTSKKIFSWNSSYPNHIRIMRR
jgi:hypothetical protein